MTEVTIVVYGYTALGQASYMYLRSIKLYFNTWIPKKHPTNIVFLQAGFAVAYGHVH